MDTVSIGQAVRKLREASEWRIEDLAHHADCAAGTVRNIEVGNGCTVDKLLDVIHALDKTPAQFFELVESG